MVQRSKKTWIGWLSSNIIRFGCIESINTLHNRQYVHFFQTIESPHFYIGLLWCITVAIWPANLHSVRCSPNYKNTNPIRKFDGKSAWELKEASQTPQNRQACTKIKFTSSELLKYSKTETLLIFQFCTAEKLTCKTAKEWYRKE